MPAYIGGPAWPALDEALVRRDFSTVLELAAHDTSVDVAERQLVIGICRAMFHQSEQAIAALVDSMQTFGAQRAARAAVAAVFLGRLHYFVHDSPSVANGWFARARTLVADAPGCIEQALVTLPLPGCDMIDVSQLRADASQALTLARRLGETNLEAKALADLGTAHVSLALVDDGMRLLDESMAMVLSGEADSPFAAIDVVCNLLSACARVGDLSRADQWTRAADRHLGLGIDQGPAFLYAHCRSNLGLILCDAGRWDEAEVALRLASGRGAQAGPRTNGQVRAALAELWVQQGRLDDAERLLAGRHEHQDSIHPLAALYLAREAWSDAASIGRRGIGLMGEDRVRAARLLVVCVEAELGRGNLEQAEADAAQLAALSDQHHLPVIQAQTALARSRVAEARGQRSQAMAACEEGLRVLTEDDWPLIRGALHLTFARLLAAHDAAAAVAQARAAHLIYERLGSPLAAQSARLLNSLGVPATARARRPDATAALSRRETQVLDLVRQGLTNAEIASRHHNSVRTIEHHVSAILAKLGLRSRAEAAAYAASMESLHSGPVRADSASG